MHTIYIKVAHTNNTHNNEIKTILDYYSQLVGQLTKVNQLLCLFCGDKVGNCWTLKSAD